MQGGFFLNVVVREGATVLELQAHETSKNASSMSMGARNKAEQAAGNCEGRG
jgi:hypothetical protein